MPDRWPGRHRAVAALIPEGARVIDIGAGAEGLREWLRDSCDYTPADVIARSPGTRIFDLTGDAIPDGAWDVAVLAGVLEYVEPEHALRLVARLAPEAIVTYSHRNQGELSEEQFEELAGRAGWEPVQVASWSTAAISRQAIWHLTRCS